MYSYFFGDYFYKNDLIKIIIEIDKERKLKRIKGDKMDSSFSEDLLKYLNE